MALRIVFPWDVLNFVNNPNEELGFANRTGFTAGLDLYPGFNRFLTNPNQSKPDHFTRLGNKLIFEAQDGNNGRELWITDGTTGGTRLLKDINPGIGNAFSTSDVDFSSRQAAAVFQPVVFNGFAYFAADDGSHGMELWRTDGTSAGTTLFADINGAGASTPMNLTVSGGLLYFAADDGNGFSLWATNGVNVVKVDNAGHGSHDPSTAPFGLTDVYGELFYLMPTPGGSPNLMTAVDSGGSTPEASVLINGSGAGIVFDTSSELVAFNGFYITGSDVFNGRHLYQVNGGMAYPFNQFTNPSDLTVFNGALYFAADDGIHGSELWTFDGTTASLFKDINPTGTNGSNSSSPANLTVVGNQLFFTANDGVHGNELWVTDGTTGGTHLVKDILAGSAGSSPTDLQNVNGTLYFAALDGGGPAYSLYRSNGTDFGTVGTTQVSANNYVPGSIYAPFGFVTPPTQSDLNADGDSDLVFQITGGTPATGGTPGFWTMTGTNIDGATVGPAVPASWQLIGTGDVNGDGKADILWQNTDGTPGIWEMNGTSIFNHATLVNPGPSWHVIASGDFNGDGKADILWQNTDGTPGIWEMNGTSIVNSAALLNPGPSWRVITSGDFNDDGKADILWQNTDGTPGIWEMNGTSLVTGAALSNPGPSWHVIASGDFNGDGFADILWQNTDGTPGIWLMNGTSILGSAALPAVPSSWRAVGTTDVNGDGTADILWQNTDGTVAVWEMNGTSLVSSTVIGNPGAFWQLKDDGPIPADQMGTGTSSGSMHLSAPDAAGVNAVVGPPTTASGSGGAGSDPGALGNMASGSLVWPGSSSFAPGSATVAASATPLMGMNEQQQKPQFAIGGA